MRASWNHVPEIRHPKLGEVLTIREVDDRFGPMALTFEGLCYDDCYRASYFRPLITRTQEQDLALFTPILDTIEEPA